jgi:diguanylate cyclase (GGDEF)-like protein/excisionase family DNA binding protein
LVNFSAYFADGAVVSPMRVGKADGDGWLRLADAAALLGVSLNTLRRWSDNGKVTCYRSPGGHRRYRRCDIAALLDAHLVGGGEAPPTALFGTDLPATVARTEAPLTVLARVAAEGLGVSSCRFSLSTGAELTLVAEFTAAGVRRAGRTGESTALADSPVPSEVLRTGRRLVIADLLETNVLSHEEAQRYLARGERSILAIPLGTVGSFAGVLELAETRAPRSFTSQNVLFAEFIAGQAAAVLGGSPPDGGGAAVLPHAQLHVDSVAATAGAPAPDSAATDSTRASPGAAAAAPAAPGDDGHGNPELVARLQRRTRDLSLVVEASLEDSARLTVDELLSAVARRLSELTASPVADIYAVEGDTLRALVSYDNGRLDEEWEGVTIPLSRYPASQRAVESGELVVVPSLDDPALTAEGRYSLEKWGYQSQLSVPLIARSRVIGLAELSDYVPRDFSEELELIRGLSQVAAHALENAALFEQVERRSKVMRELVELGTLVTQSHQLDNLLRIAAERLLSTVEAANCDIFRVSPEGFRCMVSYDQSGYDERPVGSMLELEKYPAIVAAMAAHRAIVITSPDDPQLSPQERSLYHEYGFASEVCVPLIVSDELYGLIDIYDTRQRDYSEYLDFLMSAGQTVAAACENVALFEQLERRNEVLREIVELGALTSQAHDLDDVLGTIAVRLRDTMEVADCDIFTLRGDDLRVLVSADQNGFDKSVVGKVLKLSKFPATAEAIARREILITASLDDPRLTDEEREDYSEYGYQSNLSIPLAVGDRVIGLIDVFDTRPRDFTEYLDFLKTVGQTAAGAIENAMLVHELEQRNTVLDELVELGGLVSGAGDLDHLVRTVAQRLVEVMHATGCQIFQLQGERLHCLVTYDGGEFDEAYADRPLDLDLFPSTRECIATGDALVISSPDDPRLSDHERRLYAEADSKSEICLPLIVDERCVGLLDVYDTRERDYAEYMEFFRSVGQLVGGAFANAVLVEQLEDGNIRLGMLVDSGLELGATLDMNEILSTVARRLCDVSGADCCDVYALDGQILRGLASIDREGADPEWVGTCYTTEQLPTAARAMEQQQPIGYTDCAVEPGPGAFELAEWRTWEFRGVLEMPLIYRGDVIGLVGLFSTSPNTFEHRDLLQGLGQIAANALANATLYDRLDRTAERTALVNEIGMELSSSLALEDVLVNTAKRLCAIVDVPSCDIYVLEEGDMLIPVASILENEVDHSWQGETHALSEWVTTELAVETRQPVVIASLDDPRLKREERELMNRYGEKSELAVPLIVRDEVIGVVELLETRRERLFTDEEVATVASLCRVAALAISNARLIESLRLRNRETELLNEIARTTAASLDLGEVAEAAVEKLRDVVDFDRAALVLRREDGTFELVYSRGDPPRSRRRMADDLQARLLERLNNEAVVVLDAPQAIAETAPHPGTRGLGSAVAVGLRSGSDLIGILNLGSKREHAFGDADRHMLERVGTQLALAINNASLYENIKRMHVSNLKALSSALNAKDYYTLGHAARVSAYMVLLGEELGWSTDLLQAVEEAAYLHDIGKIGVSDRVLLKPSGLNPKEWDLMRQHPVFSAEIIRPLFDDELVQGVRYHHERHDGGGYPAGLAGAEIPLIARAMGVVDSYDAMSFRRPYRQALTYPECLDELRRCSGAQFDPQMVETFIRVLARLYERHHVATAVAEAAAVVVDVKKHAMLRTREDEDGPIYKEIALALRKVRDANPGTRFVSTHKQVGKKVIFVVDAEEQEGERSHIGDDVFTDDDLVEVFADQRVERNVLYVDEFGVWVSGVAPVRDATGTIVGAISADMPATSGETEIFGLRSNVTQTFAAMLHTATARLGRAELDAITDGLTGLYNHRYLHERLAEEIERVDEQHGTLALLFCDIDKFKNYNDRHGHSAGDHALRVVAREIEGSIRHIDMATRYGGEEFAIILIDNDLPGAMEVGERIRRAVADTRPALDEDPVTLSIGVATYPRDASSKEELLDKADWAMYLAKRRGRDRVVAFGAGDGGDAAVASLAPDSKEDAAPGE